MREQRFVADVEARPRGSTAIRMPFDPSSVWGDRDRHYVAGSIEGRGLRGTLTASTPGAWFLQLGPTWCRDRRLQEGERVSVVLAPEGPQLETMAQDLASALIAEPVARRFFEGLATFYRNGYIDWVESAKRPETRARRIQDSVEALKAGRQTH